MGIAGKSLKTYSYEYEFPIIFDCITIIDTLSLPREFKLHMLFLQSDKKTDYEDCSPHKLN